MGCGEAFMRLASPERNLSFPRFLGMLLLWAAAFSRCASARSDEPHWIRVSSDHFAVVTDANEKKARETVARETPETFAT